MNISHKNRGFTLLEMMVSIFILALVLVSVFKIQSATIRLSVSGKFYATASNLARQKMADIEQKLRDSSMSNELLASELSGDFGDAFPGYRWQYVITSLELSGSQIPEAVIKQGELQKFKNLTVEISYRDQFSFKVISWRFIQNG